MPCPQILYHSPRDLDLFCSTLKKRENPDQAVFSRVRDILAHVAAKGDEALVEYTQRFDCPDFTHTMLRVPPADIAMAMGAVG